MILKSGYRTIAVSLTHNITDAVIYNILYILYFILYILYFYHVMLHGMNNFAILVYFALECLITGA